MTVRGAIYHHSTFDYGDGEFGRKFIVLLNTPGKGEPFLFVKTTSQQHYKTTIPGCQQKNDCYFIPAGKTFFPKNTWIQLFKLYTFPQDGFQNNPNISFRDYLKEKIIDDIIQCLLNVQEDDLAPIEKDLICPPINQSLLKLQKKFNTKR